MNVRTWPTIINLFTDPLHQRGHTLSRGIFTVLDELGFSLDWHNSKAPSAHSRYREIPAVELDLNHFLAYYTAQDDLSVDLTGVHRVVELQNSRSASIRNGEHVQVDGQDVILFSNTVVGSTTSLFISLFNPLQYPVLVRLTDYHDTIPEGLVDYNRTEGFELGDKAGLEGVIPPNGYIALGPIYFSPESTGVFGHYFVIVNNYTGLDPVLVAGRGILQPLLLRDSAGFVDKVGRCEIE